MSMRARQPERSGSPQELSICNICDERAPAQHVVLVVHHQITVPIRIVYDLWLEERQEKPTREVEIAEQINWTLM